MKHPYNLKLESYGESSTQYSRIFPLINCLTVGEKQQYKELKGIQTGAKFVEIPTRSYKYNFEQYFSLPHSSVDIITWKLNLVSLLSKTLSKTDTTRFFYQLALQTLNQLEANHYTCFDAHTTSNCCHGIALYVSLIIGSLRKYDTLSLISLLHTNFKALHDGKISIRGFYESLPKELIALTCAFTLNVASEMTANRGRVTSPTRLQNNLEGMSKKLSIKLTTSLQKSFSYAISTSYHHLLEAIPADFEISGCLASYWGKYVSLDYVRKDKRNRFYAPCLFSSQITLAYIIANKMKAAILCDLVDENRTLYDRCIIVFQGDGQKLIPIDQETVDILDPKEPIYIIGGFTQSNYVDKTDFTKSLEPWIRDISCLIVANDTYYPQFPLVQDDPIFNSSKITPTESILNKIIDKYSKVKGTSMQDPSFFFQNHYFITSLYELSKGFKNLLALPNSSRFSPLS